MSKLFKQGVFLTLLVVSAQVLADLEGNSTTLSLSTTTTVKPRRTPKTARTTTPTTTAASATSVKTTRSARAPTSATTSPPKSTTTAKPAKVKATHAPWPEDVTTKPRATHAPFPYASESKSKVATHDPYKSKDSNNYRYGMATHAPYPYDQYGMGHNDHFYPAKSTYAPYVYGKDSEKSKKKTMLAIPKLDRELINTWAKEMMAYLAAPLLVPAAITNAFSNIPAGLETETLWGKIARSLRAAFLRRSEERGASDEHSAADSLISKMKSKFKIGAEAFKKKINESEKELEENKTLEKKVRDLANMRNRLIDFFRWKRHRQEPSPQSV